MDLRNSNHLLKHLVFCYLTVLILVKFLSILQVDFITGIVSYNILFNYFTRNSFGTIPTLQTKKSPLYEHWHLKNLIRVDHHRSSRPQWIQSCIQGHLRWNGCSGRCKSHNHIRKHWRKHPGICICRRWSLMKPAILWWAYLWGKKRILYRLPVKNSCNMVPMVPFI